MKFPTGSIVVVLALFLKLMWFSAGQSFEFRDCMNRELNARFPTPFVFIPGEEGYRIRLGWSFQPDPNDHPVAFVDCVHVEQIQVAVTCAKRYHIGVCPRSGGHSRIGSGMCSGIVLDVWQMKTVSVSPGKTSVTIGSGLTLGELVYELHTQANRIFPVGHCPSVGATGFLLAGGLSELANDLGLGCDNLLELRMVDAGARLVVASRTERSDIFWASCGGGGGRLGIVYELTLRIHPTSPYDAHVGFLAGFSNASLVPAYLKWLYRWQEQKLRVLSRTTIDFSPKTGETKLTLRGACTESESSEECKTRLQNSGVYQFPWAPSLRQGRRAIEYLQWISGSSVSSKPEEYFKKSGKSHSQGKFVRSSDAVTAVNFKYSPEIDPPLTYFEDLVSFFYETCRSPGMVKCSMLIQNLGDGITRVDPEMTAIYGLRLARQWISFRVQGSTLDMSESVKDKLRNFLAPHSMGAFINYEDRGLKEAPKSYYGPHASQMIKVNQLMDPHCTFDSKQSLI